MAKNLTGSKRIVYDSCVDIYNAVQKWRSLTAESHSVILNMWNVKQEHLNKTDFMNEKESVQEFSQATFKELEKLISLLMSKVQNLELILVEKLKNSVKKIKAVTELSDLHQSNSSDFLSVVDCIPFKTWSLSKFNEVAKEITSMFEKEYKVKSSICKEICHNSDQHFLKFEAFWKYEPNIDKCKLDLLLTGILFDLDLILELN